VFGAYTDYVSPRFTAIAVLAALEHRRRTGRGQYIDQSQVEASAHFLAPAILQYTANGAEAGRIGNAEANLAPHGVYPTAGQDRWVVVVCRSDGEWQGLCDVMGRADLARDARLGSTAGRLEHREEIDRAVSDWTCGLEAVEIEQRLQARGIAAHAVQDSRQCYLDPQLRHRGHFVDLPHPVYRMTVVEGPRVALSRTPAGVTRCAPTVGQDNHYVLSQLLGYDEERITQLVLSGAMG
jgi:benzylsuccinate CoA-transferase BbsF subunit